MQKISIIDTAQKRERRDFPGGSVVKDSVLPLQGAWIRSLVGELRSHMLQGVAEKPPKNKKPSNHSCISSSLYPRYQT